MSHPWEISVSFTPDVLLLAVKMMRPVIKQTSTAILRPQLRLRAAILNLAGDLYTQHADGIMGLGRGDLSIMDKLVEKKVISDSFSLCYGGMVLVAVLWFLVAYLPQLTWQLHLNPKVYYGKHGTVLDSGTTYAYLPESAFLAFKHADGRTLCTSTPIYGTGKEAGNEDGYLTGMSVCYPQSGSIKIRDGETLTLESRYKNEYRTGAMVQFYIYLAEQLPQKY
ncbi:hypothetical protein VNO78_25892 [Psophocarpus tetragonolobus]|uniref:Peptidase A1 domain-containing protein n=1 Tax=Psophocarpus tetragonolobus TaxID=3891 RepID=A0AAN9XFD7_PSOTE